MDWLTLFKPRTALTCLFMVGFFTGNGLAQAIPEPIFRTTAPKRERVIAEDQYFFTVREFTPPVQVTIIKRSDASYDNPEKAAISYISAMASGDFRWSRSAWTDASQKMMEERDKALNRTPDFWLKAWEKAFRNKRIELTHRVETGEYVFIAYRLVSEAKALPPKKEEAEADVELLAVLKRDKGRWLATQELAQDPVVHYWRTPGTKVERLIRGIEIK